MRKYARRLCAVAGAAALLAVAGCTSDEGPSGENNVDGETIDEVTYVTGFGELGREAYVWVAMDKGYFADEGIELQIQAGSGSEENLALVAAGQAEFVAVDIPGMMIVHSEGGADGATIVAGVQQRSLIAIMAMEGGDIAAPSDLEGKTIAGQPGSVALLLFPTYADAAGFDAAEVEFQDAFPQELAGYLAAGSVDAVTQFTVGQGLIETIAGGPAVVLPYSDYLTDLYGGGIATSTEIVENDPDLVHRFNRALFRGLEDALNDPEEAAEIMASYVEELNVNVAASEMRLLEPYVQPSDPGAPFGVLDEQRVARGIALLESAGAISPGMTPEDIITFELVPQP